MKNCIACNNQLSDDSKFCGNCGEKQPEPVKVVEPQKVTNIDEKVVKKIKESPIDKSEDDEILTTKRKCPSCGSTKTRKKKKDFHPDPSFIFTPLSGIVDLVTKGLQNQQIQYICDTCGHTWDAHDASDNSSDVLSQPSPCATKKLYVGNLSYSTTEDGLRNLFSVFGTVVSSKIISDRETGNSKGFGFIEMSTNEEAGAAIAGINGLEFEGRQLSVNEASDKPHRERSSSGSNWW
jgi:transposase-like protein